MSDTVDLGGDRRMAPIQTNANSSTNSPGWTDPALIAANLKVAVCRDVMAGTERIREQARTYIPPFENEPKEVYEARSGQAVLYPFFRRTVKGFSGMAFRVTPELNDDVPDEMRPLLENIDLAGRHWTVYAQDTYEDKMIAGHGFIFVDWHGPTPDAVPNRAAEEAAGSRPYWTHIRKDQARRLRYRMVDGRVVWTMFAYEESDSVDDGEFGRRDIRRMRQYDLLGEGPNARVQYRSWTRDAASRGEWEPEETGVTLGERMRRIPLVVDYAGRTGAGTSDPPLLDLAYLNIRHVQVDSDRAQSLRNTMVSMLVTKGVSPDRLRTIAIGPAFGLALPDTDASAEWLEIRGTGLEQGEKELQDIEQRAANIGLSMFVRGSYRGPETATAVRDNKIEQDSEAASWLRYSRDAWEEALMLTAMWMGLDQGGTVRVNIDMSIDMPDPDFLRAMSDMVSAGQYPLEWMLGLLQRYRDLIPGGATVQDAVDLLAAAGVAELQALPVPPVRDPSAEEAQDEASLDEMTGG